MIKIEGVMTRGGIANGKFAKLGRVNRTSQTSELKEEENGKFAKLGRERTSLVTKIAPKKVLRIAYAVVAIYFKEICFIHFAKLKPISQE
ncbi:hypothetical protein CEXT_308441 [Caerostris extrusa]|uniref:Uncharacterized protein n=1 Tax=Caerostris extrusa TaxID=172846 RepID=A0AAV4M925_CAEEX|nr:hypothetical protein CEXT_308441 [Caerostris extrusa]